MLIIIKNKNYFKSLDQNNIFEKRKFWKTLKIIFLLENEFFKMIMQLQNILNVTKALGILQNVYSDLFIGDIDDPTMRAVMKYRKTF